MKPHWVTELHQLLADGHEVVRIVVTATKGSVPREAGASMLVHNHGMSGTLGGGHLEFQAIALAQALLNQAGSMAHCQRFTLGAALGQCCGGIVDLWWERFTLADLVFVATVDTQLQQRGAVVLASLVDQQYCHRALFLPGVQPASTEFLASAGEAENLLRARFDAAPVHLLTQAQGNVLLERLDRQHVPLWLFGAGHVGQAIVNYLQDFPFDITWVDSREDIFPSHLPNNVTVLVSDMPAAEVTYAPDDAWFLVLTHDHALDYAICAAILARADNGFIGLIGSRTKAARFAHQLTRQGYQAGRITCPIGIAGITGKEPATIALSVVAQLIQQREAGSATGNTQDDNFQLLRGSV